MGTYFEHFLNANLVIRETGNTAYCGTGQENRESVTHANPKDSFGRASSKGILRIGMGKTFLMITFGGNGKKAFDGIRTNPWRAGG